MYNKLGTVIAIALAIFPFAAVLAKMAETESSVTVIVVAAIFVVFFATLLIATRITIEAEPAAPAAAPRQPAPPIAWSWDGVNRQPDDDGDQPAESAQGGSHH